MIKGRALLVAIGCWLGTAALAQEDEIFDLSLEELMNMEITSASKKAERAQDIPASIYVISSEKIERSGAVTVVELLREHVPGFWAASLDFNKYDTYLRNANTTSFLVLLDGTPMIDLIWAQMFWDNFEIPLHIVERIEVVKGSGGVIYGANSATGVINIITKSTDEASGLVADINLASPLHASTDLSYGGNIKNKFSYRLHGRYRFFNGYDQMDETENPTSLVPRTFPEGDTLITNLYTEDDNTYQSFTAGASFKWQMSDRFTLSSQVNYSAVYQDIYAQAYDASTARFVFRDDTTKLSAESYPFLTNNDRSRLVGNITGSFSFSDKHQLFVRSSVNLEDAHHNFYGGYDVRNSIIDFEAQDNLEIGFNNLSIGANYRLINYDIHDLNRPQEINYIDKQNNANLSGFFVQDHLEFLEGKLNFYVGAKGENFSLLNDKYYLSPMAKFSVSPKENLTFWGGYTRSYTTPGYYLTNIEVTVVAVPTPEGFSEVIDIFAQQAVANNLGLSPAEAAAYFGTPEGQAAVQAAIPPIEQVISLVFPDYLNLSTINPDVIEPTSFDNLELGVRFRPMDQLYVESNFFYTRVRDAVTGTPLPLDTLTSPTKPPQRIAATIFGNFMEGRNFGMETMVSYQFMSGFLLELSHALFIDEQYEWQESEDFDPSIFNGATPTLSNELPAVPEHVVRGKIQYSDGSGWSVNLSGLYASAFYNRQEPFDAAYQFDRQRFEPLFGAPGERLPVGRNDNRVIVNFKISKSFGDNMTAYVYGNDVLKSAFIESVNALHTVYPRQVGRMVGLGLNLRL